MLHVNDVKYLRGHVLGVTFNDGVYGEVDLSTEMDGEVFGPLQDIDLFKTAKVDPVMRTVVWDNGADFAPEFLYEHLRIPV